MEMEYFDNDQADQESLQDSMNLMAWKEQHWDGLTEKQREDGYRSEWVDNYAENLVRAFTVKKSHYQFLNQREISEAWALSVDNTLFGQYQIYGDLKEKLNDIICKAVLDSELIATEVKCIFEIEKYDGFDSFEETFENTLFGISKLKRRIDDLCYCGDYSYCLSIMIESKRFIKWLKNNPDKRNNAESALLVFWIGGGKEKIDGANRALKSWNEGAFKYLLGDESESDLKYLLDKGCGEGAFCWYGNDDIKKEVVATAKDNIFNKRKKLLELYWLWLCKRLDDDAEKITLVITNLVWSRIIDKIAEVALSDEVALGHADITKDDLNKLLDIVGGKTVARGGAQVGRDMAKAAQQVFVLKGKLIKKKSGLKLLTIPTDISDRLKILS